MHHTNNEDQTLLYLVCLHQSYLYHIHTILINLEQRCHNNDDAQIQSCLRDNMGTSLESVKILDIMNNCVKPDLKFRMCEIFVVSLLFPLCVYLFDFATDIILVQDYYAELTGYVKQNLP
jgi:hypothetical protein